MDKSNEEGSSYFRNVFWPFDCREHEKQRRKDYGRVGPMWDN